QPRTAGIEIEADLQPKAFGMNGIKPADMTDAAGEWQRILWNQDISIYVAKRGEPAPYFVRDADGDLCYFVHRGSGTLETDYGPLTFRDGDFLVLPRGTTHRLVTQGEDYFFYVIEGRGGDRLPDAGLLARHPGIGPGGL